MGRVKTQHPLLRISQDCSKQLAESVLHTGEPGSRYVSVCTRASLCVVIAYGSYTLAVAHCVTVV